MKKLLTFVLVLAMVLSVSSVAFAAEVGDETELKNAINSVASGDTITLTGDVTLSAALEIDRDGVDLTLDLGTHTLYGMIKLKGGRLTIKNGTVSLPDGQPLNVYGHNNGESGTTNLTVEENAKIIGAYGICLFGNGDKAYNATIDIYGTIEASSSAVFVSGNIREGNSVVNIHSGADLTGGPVGTVDGVGVAVNGNATVNIEDGAKVQGPTAVEVRAGNLNITGGTFTATGDLFSAAPNNNGTTTTGAAVAVSSYNISDIKVDIRGGTFKGATAFGETYTKTDAPDKAVEISITGGDFTGDISSKNKEGFISGGTFSEMPNPAYIADNKGAVQNPDGTYSLVDAITGEYGLKIYPASLDFGTEKVGYAQPAPKAVFIQGIGGRSVTVTVPDEYEICRENGELIDNPVTIEDSPNNDGITVGIVYIRPKAGLGAGKYTGSVNVSVTNASETPEINNKPALSFAVETPYATGSGISVKYTGGNSFSTSNSAVPTGVEIDNVPVSFTGDGRNFTVSCIKPDAKWVTVSWNSTSVTSNFTPDAAAYCAPTNIPKTGDASLAAFVVMAIVAAAGAVRRK